MTVLLRDPDIDMCARTARGAEHELLHGPPSVVFQRSECKSDLVSSTVVVDWYKLANVRSSRVPAQMICCRSVLLMFQRNGEVSWPKSKWISARLLRQDKAGFPASGTSFLSFCLHIVFG